jgi:hypothetical protein
MDLRAEMVLYPCRPARGAPAFRGRAGWEWNLYVRRRGFLKGWATLASSAAGLAFPAVDQGTGPEGVATPGGAPPERQYCSCTVPRGGAVGQERPRCRGSLESCKLVAGA